MTHNNSNHEKAYNIIINNLFLKERAIDFMSDGILISDPWQKGNPIVYCNLAFELLTGYKIDDVLGKNCKLLQGKDTCPTVAQKIKKAIQNKTIFSEEILNYRKDGSSFWNHLTVSPIFDEDGKITNFLGIQRDVTKIVNMRKSLEEKTHQNQVLKMTIKNLIKRINEQEKALKKEVVK